MPSKVIRRRRFIVSGLRRMTTGIAAGCWSQLAPQASAAVSHRLRLAVIGVGNRGAWNLGAVNDEEIAALCDVDRQYLAPAAQRYPDSRQYTDWRECLDHSDLDAVVISTPDHCHFAMALMAIRKGLDVYCEKPLARTVWEVRQLASAARRAPVVTQMGNQHHRSDGYRQVERLIRAGVLGTVEEVHVWTNRPIWPQGVARPAERRAVPDGLNWDLWLGPAPERPYHPVYHPRGWRGWRDFGGGALGDMGPHLLDPVVTALDLGRPSRVRGEPTPQQETFPESSVVRYVFPARGDRPIVRVTWYDGGNMPPAGVTGSRVLPPNGILFVGQRARLFAPDYGRSPMLIPASGTAEPVADATDLTPVEPHHSEWLRACKHGGRTSCDFEFGARLTEICLLGNLAARRGGQLDPDPEAWSEPPQYRAGWQVSGSEG